MADKFTILVAPVDAYGHFNACIGLAEPLRDRGHNVIFAVPNGWKGKLNVLGFGEEWYSTGDSDEELITAQSAVQHTLMETMAHGLAMCPQDQIKSIGIASFHLLSKMTMNANSSLKKIVTKTKPDVIVFDMPFCPPALVSAGYYNNLQCYFASL